MFYTSKYILCFFTSASLLMSGMPLLLLLLLE